ncbi:MAG: hypothetical protein V3W31_08305, partial [Thermodesulfobacteriota bacterium]
MKALLEMKRTTSALLPALACTLLLIGCAAPATTTGGAAESAPAVEKSAPAVETEKTAPAAKKKVRLTGRLDKATNTRTIKVISDQWFFKPSTWKVKAGEKVVLKIDARASEMP